MVTVLVERIISFQLNYAFFFTKHQPKLLETITASIALRGKLMNEGN